jgi:23S rRNA pseudouridine2605 synthase
VPQVVVNLLYLKSRPSEKKRISGMTKSRLALKNVNLVLIVKKNQEILRPEQIALISRKKGTLAFVQVAEHLEKVEILKEDLILANLGLLKETMNRSASGERKPYGDRPTRRTDGDAPRPYSKRPSDGERKPYSDRAPRKTDGDSTRSYTKRPSSGERAPYGDRPPRRTDGEGNAARPYQKRSSFGERPYTKTLAPRKVREDALGGKGRKRPLPGKDDGLIRLNRYISNAGICSRRKADELIAAGVVSVNGEVVSELGYRVNPSKDVIRYNGETLKREKMVYVLLNKPKDYITTTDDPQERRTVMQLVEKASKERIYPVGRLDRNTTGLLLMTNDGDLADKLSHPKTGITKIYQVELNKSLPQGDLNKIAFGLELEDGLIKPDAVSYVQGGTKREIGIQIHSGRNRIVRRIFEHLGYDVVKLDRVIYANLTKKDLTRGRWRYLDEKEIIQLKHLIK